ncbi:hypothetical protein ACTHQH_01145 [Arthrobacter sp. SAFR-014]
MLDDGAGVNYRAVADCGQRAYVSVFANLAQWAEGSSPIHGGRSGHQWIGPESQAGLGKDTRSDS